MIYIKLSFINKVVQKICETEKPSQPAKFETAKNEH